MHNAGVSNQTLTETHNTYNVFKYSAKHPATCNHANSPPFGGASLLTGAFSDSIVSAPPVLSLWAA